MNISTIRFLSKMLFCLIFLRLIAAFENSLTIDEKLPIDRLIFEFPEPMELLTNFQSNFYLSSNSKALMLTRTIDRDLWCSQNICSCDQCSFSLDFVSSNEKTLKTLNITVSDVNDHSCLFLDVQDNVTLSESIQIGHRFALARAIDFDSGLNGQLSFQLVNHQEYFQLNVVNLSSNEYAIYGVVRRSLDRETIEQFELIIEGRDFGLPNARMNRTKILVSVIDENDNAPKFNQTEYSIQSLNEDTPVGSELLTIFASDADRGLNGLIHYSIVSSTGERSFPFVVDSKSGVVRLAAQLDYESKRSYRFLIRASDSGLPQSLFTDSWLSISIKDVNDCPVQVNFFPNQRFRYENQTLFIHENTEINNLTLGSFRLFDPDSIQTKLSLSIVPMELNSKQEYQLIHSNQPNLFLLVVRDGIFDREQQSEINIRFVASDGLLTSIFNLKIQLIDLNDNPGRFPSNPLRFSVEELANYKMISNPDEHFEMTIGFLNASDLDEGENSQSRYELEENSWIRVDPITGRLVLIQPLDREQIDKIVLKAKSVNLVEPKWITEVQLEIDVLDVNDNIPQCSSSFERFEIDENLAIDRSIVQIKGIDPDQQANGTIRYSLRVNGSWPFEINSQTGEIYSRREFDFESDSKRFYLEIDLEDNGFPVKNQNKNSCRVEIELKDVNDNAPQLLDLSQTRIFVDLQKLSSNGDILQFNVKDEDSNENGRIQFRLDSEDQQILSMFVVTNNGTLKTNGSISDVAFHKVRLHLEDGGSPSQQTIVNLTIAVGDSSNPSLSNFDQVGLKYSRSNNVGLIFGLTILVITVLLFVFIILTMILLRRHRQRHQAAIAARKKLLCTSIQQLTSSASTTTTNTGSSTSVDHHLLGQINSNRWQEHFYDRQSSQSYNVDSASPESRTYKILHVPQDNEHYFHYYTQEKVDNQSSDHGYHGSYETGSTSSPSQISIPRSTVTQPLPAFVTRCKSLNEGYLVEMNVDGSDEDAR